MHDDRPPKGQVPKRPLEQISQVEEPQSGRISGELVYIRTAPKGTHYWDETHRYKGQGRVEITTPFLSFFIEKSITIELEICLAQASYRLLNFRSLR